MTPHLFFRFDDIGPLNRSSLRFIDLMESLERPYILAVIPNALSWWMRQPLRATRHAKIYQHGVNHKNRSSSQQRDELPDHLGQKRIEENILRGREYLSHALERAITGYVPPWNQVSNTALRVLEEHGYRSVSSNRPLSTPLAQLPVHVDVYAQYQPVRIRSNHDIQDEIAASMATTPLTGIMLHPLSLARANFRQMEDLIRQNHADTATHATWHSILSGK